MRPTPAPHTTTPAPSAPLYEEPDPGLYECLTCDSDWIDHGVDQVSGEGFCRRCGEDLVLR